MLPHEGWHPEDMEFHGDMDKISDPLEALQAAEDSDPARSQFICIHETLRDRFAMAALTGMMCRITRESMSIEHPESVVAGIAYKFADAMLTARKQ